MTSEVNITEVCQDIPCNTSITNSIVECHETTQRLLPSVRVQDDLCLENSPTSIINTQFEEEIQPGFYIIDNPIFCTTQCIGRILIGSRNSNVPTSKGSIQFHVYKKYTPTIEFVESNDNDYFVQQQTFDVRLSYNFTLEALQAVPQGASVCVDRGDRIGFTLSGKLEVLGRVQMPGSHVAVPSSLCTGISTAVFDADPMDHMVSVVALISVRFTTGESFLSLVGNNFEVEPLFLWYSCFSSTSCIKF